MSVYAAVSLRNTWYTGAEHIDPLPFSPKEYIQKGRHTPIQAYAFLFLFCDQEIIKTGEGISVLLPKNRYTSFSSTSPCSYIR